MKLALHYELVKLYQSKRWWLVLSFVLVLQPLLALMEGQTFGQIGLDATPESHPELIEPIGQLDYLGFDALSFGLVAVVLLGSLLAASEYQHHERRMTLLLFGNRLQTFTAKVISLTLNSFILAFLSIWLTITMVHLGIGEEGLPFLRLSPLTWQLIAYAVYQWVFLLLLAFALGCLCRNAILPISLLIPQIVGLGDVLAQRWQWGHALPVVASQQMLAQPSAPWPGGLTLASWTLSLLLLAALSVHRRDTGGDQ